MAYLNTPVDKSLRNVDTDLSSDLSVQVPIWIKERNLDDLRGVVVARNFSWETVPVKQCPWWLQETDEYLTDKHRPCLPSITLCLMSCFRMHTETFNIWTHFIGSVILLLFLFLDVYFNPKVNLKQKIVYTLSVVSAVCCFTTSFLFHIFCCYSPRVSRNLNKLDYMGIALLITGSSVPWIIILFDDYTIYRNLHMLFVCTLSAMFIFMCCYDLLVLPQYRRFRTLVFILFGISVCLPLIHVGYLKHMSVLQVLYQFRLLLFAMTFFLIGAMFYLFKIPESIFPGEFNIIFQSHQIFHVFVIIGAMFHIYAVDVASNNLLKKYKF